jgi:all-trans-retinol 13,14-reductase
MNGLLLDHFAKGGYYPTGGSSVFAESFLPSILASGGRALVRAPVSQILLASDGKTALGVTVK